MNLQKVTKYDRVLQNNRRPYTVSNLSFPAYQPLLFPIRHLSQAFREVNLYKFITQFFYTFSKRRFYVISQLPGDKVFFHRILRLIYVTSPHSPFILQNFPHSPLILNNFALNGGDTSTRVFHIIPHISDCLFS